VDVTPVVKKNLYCMSSNVCVCVCLCVCVCVCGHGLGFLSFECLCVCFGCVSYSVCDLNALCD